MIQSISADDIHKSFEMISDMWNSLDSASNSYEFLYELNILSAILHVLGCYTRHKRHVPIDSVVLNETIAFVTSLIKNNDLPVNIVHNFKVIHNALYGCCGYSKVRFNGRRTDS